MNKGKFKCDKLKEIRKVIADANNIYYNPSPCTHKGDCNGTCPKCEAETHYIEDQLNLRRQAGKAIKIVGLATSILALSACNGPQQSTNACAVDEDTTVLTFMDESNVYLQGEIRLPDGFTEGLDSMTNEIPPPPPCADYKPEPVSKEFLEQLEKDTVISMTVGYPACYKSQDPTISRTSFYNEVLTYIYRSDEYKGLTEEEKSNLWYLVQFVVERNGTITNLKVAKSTNVKLDQVVYRAVNKTSGKWIAATRYERKIRTRIGRLIVADDLEPRE
ncbi:MAG: energy transducer TonB [Paludibacteraceae bacterium]|nr:energy transducer TonB [Paludibacteraceae bacterium]